MSERIAFVDESRRGQRYILACVLTEVQFLGGLRRDLRSLVSPPKRRIHFNAEPAGRRRLLLERFEQMPIEAVAVVSTIARDAREFEARAAALTSVIRLLQQARVGRLVIESRDAADREDRRTIERARLDEPNLVYEHQRPQDEPALWLSDAYAWAVGAGPTWTSLLPRTLSTLRQPAS